LLQDEHSFPHAQPHISIRRRRKHPKFVVTLPANFQDLPVVPLFAPDFRRGSGFVLLG
jgi:hypothetical protein